MQKQKKKHYHHNVRTNSTTRSRLILKIIETDSTFEKHSLRDGEEIWIGKCIHCNARMTVSLDGQTNFTIEHIVPQYTGGSDDLKNLALACGGCNSEKGIRHDRFVGKNGKADEIVQSLTLKRIARWRDRS